MRGLKGWILYTFLFGRLEKGILFHVKKLENHIPGAPKSWKTVLIISGNHVAESGGIWWNLVECGEIWRNLAEY